MSRHGSPGGGTGRRLVLASANPDKLLEMSLMLGGLGLEVLPAGELIPGWDVEETGVTLEENALLKARAAADATGLPSVADDTGLFVRALGGAPGVYTARYAGGSCSYADNVAKLLRCMMWETDRSAEFRTVAAVAAPSPGPHALVQGSIRGRIAGEPRGEGGFGYDPVFVPEEEGVGCDGTFAELDREEKNGISHRARAMAELVRLLRSGGAPWVAGPGG